MSSEVGGIGGPPPGQIPGQIEPIRGDQDKVSSHDDQNVLENINVLPSGEISITVEQTDISSDTAISRDPHSIPGDEELLQGIGDPELKGPLGVSSAMSAIEFSVEENEPSFRFSDDEIQIDIEDMTAHVPLDLDEGDIEIRIEREDQDDLTIQVDEEGKELIEGAKDASNNETEPENPESKPRIRYFLRGAINNLEKWIRQRMGR